MDLDRYQILDLGAERLGWQLATPEGKETMVTDLLLSAELQSIILSTDQACLSGE
jgi:hypothetical protein